MDKEKKRFLVLSYCTIVVVVLLSASLHVSKFIDLSLFVGLTGSFLALFQIVLAFHIYWKQNISDEEVKAIVHIMKTQGAKEIAKLMCNFGSLSLKTMYHELGGSKTKLSNTLYALEDIKIIISRPFYTSGKYTRIYLLNPKFRRIVEKFKQAFG